MFLEVNPQPEFRLAENAVVASVVTPFRDDERIDYGAWQTILESIVAAGAGLVLAAGDEGEWHSLSEEERIVVLRFCRQTLVSPARLLGNAAAGSTRESVRIARAAESEGVDGLVVLRPFAPALSAAEWDAYLDDIRASVRIPVFAAADLNLQPAANVAPRACVERALALAAGRKEDAARLDALLVPLQTALSRRPAPVVLKEAMRQAGIPAGVCRRPLGALPAEEARRVHDAVAALREAGLLPDLAAPARVSPAV